MQLHTFCIHQSHQKNHCEKMQLQISLLLCAAVAAEWYELKGATKTQSTVQPAYVHAFQTQMPDPITPSPEWIAYQRERFSVEHNPSAQQQRPSGNETTENTPRHMTVQVKTRIEITKITRNDTQQPPKQHKQQFKVQTTPRKDMSHETVEEDESETATVEEVQEANVSDNDSTQSDDDDHDSEDYDTQEQETNENTLEYPSINGFVKFLKAIQRNWLKKSGFNIEQKIKSLKRLRDRLMRIIEQQFSALWSPDESRRHKRGILEESNLNFPPEAALMSINFLTFAVFLIKLVLQVVHTIKSKHFSFSGFGVTSDTLTKTAIRTKI